MAAPNNETVGWHDVDDETLNLIIQLQQDDLRQLLAPADGGRNARRGPSDAELAIRLYNEELNNVAAVASDRHLTLQIEEENQGHYDLESELEYEDSDTDPVEVRAFAVAVQSSATSVDSAGKHAAARNGMKSIYTIARK
ncbi:hypothetical protein Daesc_003324 [Daldinia eschscholtzii]|uniref:Uncharacterized protein n=1 Tax=Daldinia eschscholtzii TaxID=292717 RepID=A0AAX6MU28_9PEZI